MLFIIYLSVHLTIFYNLLYSWVGKFTFMELKIRCFSPLRLVSLWCFSPVDVLSLKNFCPLDILFLDIFPLDVLSLYPNLYTTASVNSIFSVSRIDLSDLEIDMCCAKYGVLDRLTTEASVPSVEVSINKNNIIMEAFEINMKLLLIMYIDNWAC